MNKNAIIILLAVMLIASAAGCSKETKDIKKTEGKTTESAATEVGGDIADVDDLDKELRMGELENLETDLSQVDW